MQYLNFTYTFFCLNQSKHSVISFMVLFSSFATPYGHLFAKVPGQHFHFWPLQSMNEYEQTQDCFCSNSKLSIQGNYGNIEANGELWWLLSYQSTCAFSQLFLPCLLPQLLIPIKTCYLSHVFLFPLSFVSSLSLLLASLPSWRFSLSSLPFLCSPHLLPSHAWFSLVPSRYLWLNSPPQLK